MDRADDRGLTATTRVLPAPRVTLNWQAVPFTCRGKVETKWKRERNGRKVLQTSTGGGKVKYWRAPRPRPRLYRRRKRQCKKQVLHKTMSQEKIVPVSLAEAHIAIQVLQGALRAALLRETKVGAQLRQEIDKNSAMTPPQPGDAELPRSEAAESGFEGVTRNKSGWAAHTERCAGKRKHLGTFKTPVEAARARRDNGAMFDVQDVAAVAEVQDYPFELRSPGEIKFDMKLTPHQYHMRKHYHQLAQQQENTDVVAAMQSQETPTDWSGTLFDAVLCLLAVNFVWYLTCKFWP